MTSPAEFFTEIYHHAPHAHLVRWGPTNRPVYPTVDDVLDQVVDYTSSDIFFSPATFVSPQATKEYVAGASVAWCDADGGERDPLIPPSIVVASGKTNAEGEPEGFHLYWLLTRRLETVEEIERVNQALRDHTNADHAWNANRILRVPGSLSTKYGDEREVRILHFWPNRRYNPDDLARVQSYSGGFIEVRGSESVSERDFRVAAQLVRWGITPETIYQVLEAISLKAKGEGDHYIRLTVDNALKKANEPKKKSGTDGLFNITESVVKAKGSKTQDVDGDTPANLGNVDFLPVARLVTSDGEDKGLVISVEWMDGDDRRSKQIATTQQDFATRRAVLETLSKVGGTLIWRGSDAQALKLWEALVEYTPADQRLLAVESLGRYDTPEGSVFVVDENTTLLEDGAKGSVFWLPQIKVGRHVTLSDGEPDRDVINRVLALSKQTQPPDVVASTFSWLGASLFKTVFEGFDIRLPHLLLFGLRGTGKTSYIQHVLLPFAGIKTPPVSSDITPFALTGHLASTNAFPVWIGEYRGANSNSQEVERMLRTLYDGSTVERGRPDLTVTHFELRAPVIIDGETLLVDAAVRDRTLSVRLRASTIEPGSQAYLAFMGLRDIDETDRQKLARQLLTWSLTLDRGLLYTWYHEGREIFEPRQYGARGTSNAAVLYAGGQVIRKFLADKGYDQIFDLNPALYEPTLSNTYTAGLGTRTSAERLVEFACRKAASGTGFTFWDPVERFIYFGVGAMMGYFARSMGGREDVNPEIILPQLEDRVGVYLHEILPSYKTFGRTAVVNVDAARDLGMDIAEPNGNRGLAGDLISLVEKGEADD